MGGPERLTRGERKLNVCQEEVMFSYEGKKAIVTGGGRGIGKAIALAFARQGAVVALAARSRGELENAAAEVEKVGGKAWTFPTDIIDTEAAQNMVEGAAKAMGGLDILVNNAGGGLDQPGAGRRGDRSSTPPSTSARTRPAGPPG